MSTCTWNVVCTMFHNILNTGQYWKCNTQCVHNMNLHSIFLLLYIQSANSSAQVSTVTDGSTTDATPVGQDEVMAFMTSCSNCHSPTETRMKLVGILPDNGCITSARHSGADTWSMYFLGPGLLRLQLCSV